MSMALSKTFFLDSACKMQLIDAKFTFSPLAKLEVWSHKISLPNLIQLKISLVNHFGLVKKAFLQEINS